MVNPALPAKDGKSLFATAMPTDRNWRRIVHSYDFAVFEIGRV